jgi:hypothetical protein
MRARPYLVTLSFLNYLRGFLVVSDPNKFGMSQMISSGPFHKLNLCDNLHRRWDILAATLTVNTARFELSGPGNTNLQSRRIKGENNPQVRKFDSIGPMEHQ